MVPIPPKYRAYIKAFNGIKAKSIPSPIGLSLVTDHTYCKLISFYKNKNNDPFFCNWQKIEHNFAQTLEYYFPFTGRLVKKENGRYDIAHFDKGALFEVADSADTFSDYSNSNFSYNTVPYDELIPITAFVSLSCPILGIKVTILKDSSFVIGYVINHKLADGNCMTEFIKLFCRISKGETISENEVIFYTDKDREPVKPLAGVDITLVYPRIPFKKRPLPTVPFKGPARRLVFSMSKQNEAQLKNDVLQEAGQQGAKISRFNVFFSLLRKAITKARLLDDEFNGELVCAIGNHYKCKDKNMIKYLGNYAMLAPFPSTVKQVMNKSIFDLATELREKASEITVPYMEAVEYYLNNHDHVEELLNPLFRTHYGAIAVTDWTRFTDRFDFGCGPCTMFRNSLEFNPMPQITTTIGYTGNMEAVIQLDPASMDRLLNDRDFMKYISAVN